MGHNRHEFVLSAIAIGLMKASGYGLECARCPVPLKIGDEVVSRNGNAHNSHRRYYHKRCWEATFH